jgi:hypothetical protein
MRLKGWASLLLATCFVGASARADVTSIITDSFASETATYNPAVNPWQTLNFTNFQNWNVTRGSIDLVNTGGTYPSAWFNHGVVFNPSFTFVDLDGTSGHSGQLTSKNAFNLQPGQYRLSFDLAGAQGRDPQHHSDGVTVKLNGLGLTNHYELAWDAPFSTETVDFTVNSPTSTTLSFENDSSDPSSLNDNQGPLLSNINLVNLTGGIASVPEAGTLLLGLGLGASLFALRRMTRKPFAPAAA